jgi:hypothetical protein
MAIVYVSFDPTAKPPVTVDPDPLDIDTTGTEIIHWRPAANTPKQFTFIALVFTDPNPFCGVVVNPKEITARDNTKGPDRHNYIIWVTDGGGNYYSSVGKIGEGGGPTIRNN